MANLDHTKIATFKKAAKPRQMSGAELRHSIQADISEICAGMGKPRYSPQAAKFMEAEPVRRIDPNSPEGRAIATRIGMPP